MQDLIWDLRFAYHWLIRADDNGCRFAGSWMLWRFLDRNTAVIRSCWCCVSVATITAVMQFITSCCGNLPCASPIAAKMCPIHFRARCHLRQPKVPSLWWTGWIGSADEIVNKLQKWTAEDNWSGLAVQPTASKHWRNLSTVTSHWKLPTEPHPSSLICQLTPARSGW